jgi:hypothetical protein
MTLCIGMIHEFQPPDMFIRGFLYPLLQENGSICLRDKGPPEVQEAMS